MKQPFLVVYDYGMGGVWAIIKAASKREVLTKYPELQVLEKRPSWMSEEYFEQIAKKTYDIDDEPPGWLSKLQLPRRADETSILLKEYGGNAMQSDVGPLLEEFKAGAWRDHTGLWEIIKQLKHEGQDPEDVKRRTLEFVTRLLNAGFVAGYNRGRNFENWPDQCVSSVLERIDREWSELNREPNIGDIVWFDLPGARRPT